MLKRINSQLPTIEATVASMVGKVAPRITIWDSLNSLAYVDIPIDPLKRNLFHIARCTPTVTRPITGLFHKDLATCNAILSGGWFGGRGGATLQTTTYLNNYSVKLHNGNINVTTSGVGMNAIIDVSPYYMTHSSAFRDVSSYEWIYSGTATMAPLYLTDCNVFRCGVDLGIFNTGTITHYEWEL